MEQASRPRQERLPSNPLQMRKLTALCLALDGTSVYGTARNSLQF